MVAAVCFVLSTRRRREGWQCRYAAGYVTRLNVGGVTPLLYGAPRRHCAAGSILADCRQYKYAARRVTRLDSSLLQAVLSRSMARGRLQKLLVWLVIAAVDSFVLTTRQRQLLALPA